MSAAIKPVSATRRARQSLYAGLLMPQLSGSAVTPTLDQTLLAGQLVGYGLSVMLASLLAVLAWRSRGPARHARVLFAACGAAWSLGGLLRFGLVACGSIAGESVLIAWLECLSFSAAAIWPISLSLLWASYPDLSPRRLVASRWLVRIASATAFLLVVAFVVVLYEGPDKSGDALRRLLPSEQLRMLVAYNALAMLICGIALIRGHLHSTSERLAAALMLLGPLLSITAHRIGAVLVLPIRWESALELFGKQSILLTIAGGLFYVGRFEAVDRLAKLSLRVVLAWSLGVASAVLVRGFIPYAASQSAAPRATGFALTACAIAICVFLFTVFGRIAERWVDRQVFGRIDPRVALMELRERLSREDSTEAVLDAAKLFLGEVFDLVVTLRERPANAVAGSTTERGLSSVYSADRGICSARLLPVQVGDTEPLNLSIEHKTRRILLSAEIEVVNQVVQLIGRRLEALERERERIERTGREASLVHQVVDAKLRALRAQINPHFLFNSFNTIASLVHQRPAVAEAMTLRLARIFRYVLTRTEQPFCSLQEEIDFLRAYLDIEQIRFGDRLTVDFQVAEALTGNQIPSLILQPLVENAIKHGLSPKIGACRLVVCGIAEGEQLVLSVEDDGVGARSTDAGGMGASTGTGLRNIRERLATLYGERAHLSFESRPQRGSRATLCVPLHATRR